MDEIKVWTTLRRLAEHDLIILDHIDKAANLITKLAMAGIQQSSEITKLKAEADRQACLIVKLKSAIGVEWEATFDAPGRTGPFPVGVPPHVDKPDFPRGGGDPGGDGVGDGDGPKKGA